MAWLDLDEVAKEFDTYSTLSDVDQFRLESIWSNRGKAWREANKEHIAAASKKWRDANPDRVKAHDRKYYETHKEVRSAKIKAWKDANPDKVREICKRYEARKLAELKADPVAYEAYLVKRRAYDALCRAKKKEAKRVSN